MLAAVAVVGQTQWPVKIRNLSSWGALVETQARTDRGTTVMLMRGSLRAAGEVMWQCNDEFGLKFFAPISVEEWLRSINYKVDPDTNQNKVASRSNKDALTEEALLRRIAEEIACVGRAIENVADLLSQDAILRIRHIRSLQELCIAEQGLAGISKILKDGITVDSIHRHAVGVLRQRLLR